jgi:hypothetical protein
MDDNRRWIAPAVVGLTLAMALAAAGLRNLAGRLDRLEAGRCPCYAAAPGGPRP